MFPHINDINWQHICSSKTHNYIKKFLLFLVSVAILIFLTTPTAIVQVVSKNGVVKDTLSLKWTDQIPGVFGFVVKSLIPPLLVLTINQILLLLISLLGNFHFTLVSLENNHRFSGYQTSVLRYTFIYFLFNMLIIPGFAATAFSNIFDILNEGFINSKSLLQRLFALASGDFFLILIMQQAGGAILVQLSCIGDVMMNYFSPYFLLQSKRIIPARFEFLTKNDDTVFSFGLYYAQVLVIIGIGIVFQ